MTTAQQPSSAMAIIDPVIDRLPIARQVFGDERMSLIRALLPDNFTAADIADVEQFAIIVQRTKLDFFARPPQIYAIRRWDRAQKRKVLTAQASIDSFRLVAARTREYLGQVGPYWCGEDEVWKDVWLSDKEPKAAKVGVLRKGFKDPIWSVAVWDRAAQYLEDSNGQKYLSPFWKTMGPEMLAKTAETNALKRGFPNDTEGLELAAIAAEMRAAQDGLASRYTEIYGSDEDGSAFAELPAGKGAPAYAVEAPQELVEHDGRVVDGQSGEVLQDKAPEVTPEREEPPPAPTSTRMSKDMRRGETLELYGALLTQARQSGLIPDTDMPKWSLRPDMPEVQIISKGRELRALLNAATVARATAGPQPPDPSPEPEPEPVPAEKPEMVTTKSPLGQKLAALVQEAAAAEVDFSDAQIEFPAPKETVIRVIERLEDRIARKAGGLAELPEF